MIIQRHTIEKTRQGYNVILYIEHNGTEFSEEFGFINNDKIEKITQNINDYIKEKLPDLAVNTVKVMVGSMLIATIPMGIGQTFALDSAKIQNNITNVQSQTSYQTYNVQPGDSLWLISQKFNTSIQNIKDINHLTSDTIYVGQELNIKPIEQPVESSQYVVQPGDTLWLIANKHNTSVSELKSINQLSGDMIYVGQVLKLTSTVSKLPEVPKEDTNTATYSVQSGDTLWKIANNYNTTVDAIQNANGLTGTMLYVGQSLIIPAAFEAPPKPVQEETTYVVQPGDTVSGIADKFNMSTADLLKYNYMESDEWFSAGQKIYISEYAPRDYAVTPGEATAPATKGTLTDWYKDGQYILKRGDVFTIVDVNTGKQFQVTMIGGYNHSDIEPVTSQDTAIMKEVFGTWEWSPRAVVIYKDGMNIAGSLSGQPHDIDTIGGNNVDGHFDLYLLNSTSHSTTTSKAYIQQHQDMVYKAAGINR